MKVDCCDFCMKILKSYNDIYKYVIDYKEYELCEECYDDLIKIANKKKEAIDRAKNSFANDFYKLLERKKVKNEGNTKENNI